MKRRVYIAAGHGGGDSGAVARGTSEAAQTIDITNRLIGKLRADGQVEVFHVPNELGLIDSINWINRNSAGLEDGYAVEIHKNSGGGSGVETWFYGGDAQSQAFAKVLNDKLAAYTGLPNRGVKPDTSNRHGRLGFVRDTKPWAGLVEVGFIDVDHFDNEKYAHGLFLGILALWGLSPKQAPAPQPQPAPAPKADWIWKVVSTADGKQLGVYKEMDNAWNKYQSVQGAAKILDPAGVDKTGVFVQTYRPQQEAPKEPAQPHPVTPSEDYKKILDELGIIKAAVLWIQSLLGKVFK